MALIDNLVSYWKLEEASGTRNDEHGSNDLTDNNTTTNAAGILGNGALMAGANDEYLSITDASQTGLDAQTDFSISFWYKPTTLGGGHIFGKWTHATQNQYRLDLSSTQMTLYTADACAGYSYTGKSWTHSMSAGTIYHFVLTYNRTTGGVELFKDGSSLGTGTVKAAVRNCTGVFCLGTISPYTETINGLLDEVGWWSRVLTSTEVTELYNSGAGLAYPFSSPTNTTNFFAMM